MLADITRLYFWCLMLFKPNDFYMVDEVDARRIEVTM